MRCEGPIVIVVACWQRPNEEWHAGGSADHYRRARPTHSGGSVRRGRRQPAICVDNQCTFAGLRVPAWQSARREAWLPVWRWAGST